MTSASCACQQSETALETNLQQGFQGKTALQRLSRPLAPHQTKPLRVSYPMPVGGASGLPLDQTRAPLG